MAIWAYFARRSSPTAFGSFNFEFTEAVPFDRKTRPLFRDASSGEDDDAEQKEKQETDEHDQDQKLGYPR